MPEVMEDLRLSYVTEGAQSSDGLERPSEEVGEWLGMVGVRRKKEGRDGASDAWE